MSAEKTCPACGQTIRPPLALGSVRLSKTKKSLFDMVQSAGPHGINAESIVDRLCGNDPNGGPLNAIDTVRVMVWKINQKLRPLGKEIGAIYGGGHGTYGQYTLRDYRTKPPRK